MAEHVLLKLQKRLFSILVNDTELGTLIKGVFDNVPDGQKKPYVTIGDIDLQDFGARGLNGFEGVVVLHTWSETPGREEALKIVSRLYTLLHERDLAVTGHPTLSFRCVMSQVLKESDNRTHHGVQRFRILIGGN